MILLFCDSGFSPKEVDYMYAEEYAAAKKTPLNIFLISFEAIKREDFDLAIRLVKTSVEKETAIYRGWMLKPSQYKALYMALLEYEFLYASPEYSL